MRTQSIRGGDPQIEKEICALVKDDTRFVMMEMRTVHRENLVVPVTLLFSDGTIQSAFSRNISCSGVCLIGSEPIDDHLIVDLEIYRLNKPPLMISSESRWSKAFGQECYMSGWKFLRLRRR